MLGEVDLIVFGEQEGRKIVFKCLVCSTRGTDGYQVIAAWKQGWVIEQFHWSLKRAPHLSNERFKTEGRFQAHLALRVLGCGLAQLMRWLNRREWTTVPSMVAENADTAAHWLPEFRKGLAEASAISAAPANKALKAGTC